MKPEESSFFQKFGNSAILLCTAIALYLAYYLTVVSKRPKLPPGPMGVPLLGNLVQMVKDPHLKLSSWAKRYGKMYTIQMANRSALIVNDAKWMKELFATPASTGKFESDTCLLASQGHYGILNTVGRAWEEQRQFCIRSLREFGYGKSSSMEPLILQEAHELSAWIASTIQADPDTSLEISKVLYQCTLNALWVLVAGERLQLDDSNYYKLLTDWTAALQYSVQTGLGFFPWLKYIAPNLSGYVALDKRSKDIHAFIASKFAEHRQTYVEGQTRDLLDAYIEQMNKTDANNDTASSFFGKLGRQNSLSSVVEIFLAGAETTTTTIRWLAVYLSFNLEVQNKVQSEIDEIVGREREPTLVDKTRMPYTEAVILETLRLSPALMLGIPHELLEEIQFHGYTLPKGMILMANLYHVQRNPEVWGDPDTFRPERFLGEAGQRLKEHLVPFLAGKRQCLGEGLARDVLFLFVAKLFHQFSLRPDSSISKEEYLTPDVGIMFLPGCSKFVVSKR